MMAAAWLMLSTLLYSLQLSTGSFPKPLSAEEEKTYLTQAQRGDLDARNILIERNLRLVAHIVKKYYSQTADQEDLISIGTIGLIKGISTFDAGKGARLATYAARCVENATLSQVRLTADALHPKGQTSRLLRFSLDFRGDSVETSFLLGNCITKAGNGLSHQVCSLLCAFTVSMTASRSSSFCRSGQFSDFSRWVTVLA